MNRVFRKIHLWLSVPVGLIITVICLTGAALVFERDITESFNPELYKVTYTEGETPLSPSELVTCIRRQVPDSLELLSLQLPGERDAVCMATFKDMGKRSLSVNPYTGKVNGWSKSYPFFQTMRKLHRWLMDPPAYKGAKSAGKLIVGVATLVMVVILVSGVVIWIPRTRKALKSRLLVSCTKGWRRFWYDSHVSLGIYVTLFLLVMALTGLTWSFQWYRTAAYGLFGVSTSRPAMSAPQQQNKREKKEKAEFNYGVWDDVISELQTRYSSYASISLTAEKAQVNKPGNMRDSDTVTFDAQTGEIKTVTAYSDVPKAQKMKGWFYAFHTGSWGGMTTKVLYFLAAFIGGILPLSGYYLWLKKKQVSKRKKI
ncbi:PepSY domain-containing protein [Bacteroides ovatus]|uniref:PepSY-associated TM helix domain-containing protein n=1 Tax=Bacteroides ovatus TaxID=28116 RepID=UPI00216576C2|nr:PepSY-associated TM helix domain-containing protein [Bacteroides ovatus]MCS2930641.1 PepSY domain-containing protein [Bacteroides ovatus]